MMFLSLWNISEVVQHSSIALFSIYFVWFSSKPKSTNYSFKMSFQISSELLQLCSKTMQYCWLIVQIYIMFYETVLDQHAPVSGSHSSFPHHTQTLSHRILSQSPHPGHLSTQKHSIFLLGANEIWCLLILDVSLKVVLINSVIRVILKFYDIYLLCTWVSVILEPGIRQNKPMLLPLQRHSRFHFTFKYHSYQNNTSPAGWFVNDCVCVCAHKYVWCV